MSVNTETDTNTGFVYYCKGKNGDNCLWLSTIHVARDGLTTSILNLGNVKG